MLENNSGRAIRFYKEGRGYARVVSTLREWLGLL